MNPTLSSPLPEAKTSSQALWSLILGILSITCLWLLGAIPAIILGILAIKNIDRSGGSMKGRGMGIAGIVTGSIGIFAGIGTMAVLAGIALPAFSGVRIKAMQTQEMSQIKQISLGCRVYASDNKGDFPESLAALVDGGYLDAQILEPKSAVGQTFLYRPGQTDTSPAEEPILASPVPVERKRAVGLVDGSVKIVTEEEFQAAYAALFP